MTSHAHRLPRSVSPAGGEPPVYTTLWIGQRQSAAFRDAYEYCELSSAQMAHRVDFADAAARPASNVRWVVVARVDRSPLPQSLLQTAAKRYCDADWLTLEGPHCAGAMRRSVDRSLESVRSSTTCYLHQWHQHLPGWMADATRSPGSVQYLAPRSLGIIADQFHNAETLMDLACGAAVAAVWLPTAHSHRMRNFDLLWWDDSVAFATSSRDWSKRLGRDRPSAPGGRSRAANVWLTNNPCYLAASRAIAGGIDLVLTKPLRIETLLHTLEGVGSIISAAPSTSISPSRFAA